MIISCRKCKESFQLKKILHHAINSDCKDIYCEDHLKSLRLHSEQIRAAKRKIQMAVNYQMNKSRIAEKRKKNYNKIERAAKHKKTYNKIERAARHKKTYDKSSRAQKYQMDRETISNSYDRFARKEKYLRTKDIIASKYDRVRRAKKYQREKEKLAQKYRDDKEEIESIEGKQFL